MNQEQSDIGEQLKQLKIFSRVVRPGSSTPPYMPSPPYPPTPWPWPECPIAPTPNCTGWQSIIWTSTNNIARFIPGNWADESTIASLDVPDEYALFEFQYDITDMMQFTNDVWTGPDGKAYKYMYVEVDL